MKNHLFKILIILICFCFSYFSPFKIIIVRGNSMLPTIKNNQIVIGMESNNFEVNDIIVAQVEGDYIIKRIKFKEGDKIFYHFDKYQSTPFLINDSDFNKESKIKNHWILQKIVVPENKIYLLGDNLKASDDSRRFGFVEESDLKYKIIYPRF